MAEQLAGALPVCGVMGDNEPFDFFQDMYLARGDSDRELSDRPDARRLYTNPLQGWQATRTRLGTPYPSTLTPAGTLFKQIIENLSGGDRPVYDEGFVGSNGGDFAFNFGSAVSGPGRENFDTVYQVDTDPTLSPEEQQFNNTVDPGDRLHTGSRQKRLLQPGHQLSALTAKFKIPVADPAHARRALRALFHGTGLCAPGHRGRNRRSAGAAGDPR